MKSSGVHAMCRSYEKALSIRPKVSLYVTKGIFKPKPEIKDTKVTTSSPAALQRDTFL